MGLGRVAGCTLAACLVFGSSGFAQVDSQPSSSQTSIATVPRVVQTRGVLRDESGKPLTGNLGVTFTLYKDENGFVPIWQEFQNVKLNSTGHYTVLLGASNEDGLPLEIFAAGEAHWLGVRPDGQAEQPLIQLLSVPYALKAADADMLGGMPASAFVLANGQNSPAPLSSGTSPSPGVSQGPQFGVQPDGSCASITSDGTATANQLAKFTAACNIENSAIFESGGKVGIGNTSPAAVLDVSGTGLFRNSVDFLGSAIVDPVSTATPSQGYSSNPLDMEASVYNASLNQPVDYLFRWQSVPVGNDTATPSAALNLLYGVPGLVSSTGLSVAKDGTVTFVTGQTFPGAGTVTKVSTGAGLTGGPITKTGTISIPDAGITNNMLANASITVQAGSGLSGGGTVALGGTVTLAGTGGTVTSVGSGTGLKGGPITSSGTLTLDTNYTDGRYLQLSGGTLNGGLSGTTAAFSSSVTAAGALLPSTGTATASAGFNSNPLDSQASSFSSKTQSAISQDFRWLTEPTGNNTSNPSGALHLLFGSNGNPPAETGLSIASNGQIAFASGQTFPGTGNGTVTSVGTGAGLTGGPITTSGTISIPNAGVTNSMLSNSSITVQAGSGLSGGGTVALGGTVTLQGNLSGATNGIAYFSNPSSVTSTAAPTNGQILIGSSGKTPALATLTAGSNIAITNGPGSVTISATGGGSQILPFFVTGGARTGTSQLAVQNITKVWGILLPYNVNTTQVNYDVTTTDNTANNYDLGLYDNSGNLMVNIGSTAGSTFAGSKGFHTMSWQQGSVNLPAGRYYLGFTTNCASGCAKIAASPSNISFAVNASAGGSQSGALPSAITPPGDRWNTGTQPAVVIQ